MTRRLFTACLGTETNSFSPIPTGLGLFGRTMLVRDGRFDATPGGGQRLGAQGVGGGGALG